MHEIAARGLPLGRRWLDGQLTVSAIAVVGSSELRVPPEIYWTVLMLVTLAGTVWAVQVERDQLKRNRFLIL